MAKNNKKIVENYSQEKYDKRYGKSNLRKFTTKFIDKYPSLLEGSRWCKIGDSYYELPKNPFKHWIKGLSVASKVALSVIGVGAVTTAVAVPTVAAINNRIVTKDVTPEGSGSALVNDVTFTKEAGSNYKGVISLHQGVTAEAIESVTIKVGDVTLTKDTDYTLNIETGEIEIQATKVTSIEAITVVVTKRTVFAVTGIKLDSSVKSMLINDKVQLVPTISPSNATNKKVKWTSSNKYVATVDQDGNVSAKKEGTATITATTVDGGFEAKCKLSVSYNGVKVEKIEMDDTRHVYAGNGPESEPQYLHASVFPSNASNPKIKYVSSDTSVATVDENGYVRAALDSSTTSGFATITAYSVQNPTIKASCTVYADWLLNSISLTSTASTIDVNNDESSRTATLTINKNPGQSTEINNIIWELEEEDKDYATIEGNGESATLTATKGGKQVTVNVSCRNENGELLTAQYPVTVENSLVESISLDKTTLTVNDNTGVEPTQLIATVLPADSKYANSLTWSSSNEDAVLVTSEGKVSAKPGFTTSNRISTVTVKTSEDKYSSISATCQVTAYRRVESIGFSQSSYTITGYGQCTVSAKVYPENALKQTITYSSEDTNVATVNSSTGVVTTKDNLTGNTSVRIKATADDVSAYVVVYVNYVALEGTMVSPSSDIKLYEGGSLTFTVTYVPSNASNRIIHWLSYHQSDNYKFNPIYGSGSSTLTSHTSTRKKCGLVISNSKGGKHEITINEDCD